MNMAGAALTQFCVSGKTADPEISSTGIQLSRLRLVIITLIYQFFRYTSVFFSKILKKLKI